MKHNERDDTPTGGILSRQERTCEECGQIFIVLRIELWTYKLAISGKTHWFCRYNCMWAGERKLKKSKGRQGICPNLINY